MNNILSLLKENARLSNKELAVMLGKSEEDIKSAIEKLEKDGIIKGYSVILNEELLDEESVTAKIEVRVTPQRDYGFDKIARTIMEYPEVQSLTLMSGKYDLSVTAKGKNVKQIGLFVSQKLSAIPGVISTSTYFILKRYKDKGIEIADELRDEREFVSP